MHKIIHFITFLCVMLFSCSAVYARSTINPPYPEVWGYDLSQVPAVTWGTSDIKAYRMQDGDLWFVLTHSYKTESSLPIPSDNVDTKYVLLKFFKGQQQEFSQKDYQKILTSIEKKGTLLDYNPSETFSFSDESTLRFYPIESVVRFYVPDFYGSYFIKMDAKGNENKFSILAASSQVEMCSNGGFAKSDAKLFLYKRLYVLSQIIPLKDDTFIVFSKKGNLILRFDKDLKTKFKPVTPIMLRDGNELYIPRNFFVISYELINNLGTHSLNEPSTLYQNIHDGLMQYFEKQYRKNQ